MFEKAARNKTRWNYNGLISAEDLWALNIHKLDNIYKELKNEAKNLEGNSLLEENKNDEELELKINIVGLCQKLW